MKYTAIYIVALALTAAGAVAHGYVTGRWSPQGPAVSVRLPDVPAGWGDWRSEPLKSGLDDPALSNVTRKFVHAKSGRVFTVSLTLGPAGLVSQHTPEYCYPGSGYQAVGTTQTWSPTGVGEFRTAVYRKGAGEALRIFWAWSPDGAWTAPKVPELSFLRGSLHKLYIVSWDADRDIHNDAELAEFVKQLTTQWGGALFSRSTPGETVQP